MKVKQFLDDPYFILWKLSGEPLQGSYWETYLKEQPEYKEDFEEACRILERLKLQKTSMNELRKAQLENRIFTNITLPDKHSKRSLIRFPYSVKVAIAVAAGLLLTLLIRNVFFTGNQSAEPVIVHTDLSQENVELITGTDIINLEEDNALLQIDTTGTIRYDNRSVSASNKATLELRVPYGKRSKLVLEDGSTLWINSGTTVKFPSVFEKDVRRIAVNGEIYIDVAKDPKKAFSITTPNFDVNVYGTSFNLNAYGESPEATVALVEGSLAVTDTTGREVFIAPNEKITINAGKMTKSPARIEEHISWHQGYLVFDQTPIAEVLNSLSRYYNINFEFGTESLDEKTCTGKIFLSDNLQNVVKTLSVLSDTSFHIKEKAN